jgi:hypothetical protein
MFFIRECPSRVYIALSILYINIYSGREYNNRCLVKVLRYYIYIYVYNIVICIRRAFQRGTSISIIVQTNWSDFLFHLFILLRWCTSTFFAVFNEARTCNNIFGENVQTLCKRYIINTPIARLQSGDRFIMAPVARRTDFLLGNGPYY